MKPPQEVYYGSNHVKPISIYLRSGRGLYRPITDLQIVAELKNLKDPIKQIHSLSIYVKPPNSVHYQLMSTEYSIKQVGDNLYDFNLSQIIDSPDRNPYISWHGSGEIHANAYHKDKGVETHRIVENKPAISWRDVVMAPNLVLRAIIPLSKNITLQNIPNGNTVNLISDRDTMRFVKNIDNIIIDETKLTTDSVHIDVYVHNRGYQIENYNNLPFPNGSELIWLSAPLTFQNKDSVFAPGVTVFFYQPVSNSKHDKKRAPLILSGISLNHPFEDIYIQASEII